MSILEPLKALEYCEKQVKQKDFATYLHGLFLPYEIRAFFYVIHALRLELVLAREQILHSTLLSTKETWWLENLDQIWSNNPAQEPISVALNELRKYHVTRKSHFERLIKGHFEEPSLTSWRAFDRYIDNNFTMSTYATIELLHMFKEPEFNVATYAGRAWGVMELLLRTKYYAEQGRFYFPKELLEKYGIPEGVLREDEKNNTNVVPEQIFDAVLEVAAYGKSNLEKARELQGTLPKYCYMAFLNMPTVEEYYLKLEKRNFNVFESKTNKFFWPKVFIKIGRAARKRTF